MSGHHGRWMLREPQTGAWRVATVSDLLRIATPVARALRGAALVADTRTVSAAGDPPGVIRGRAE